MKKTIMTSLDTSSSHTGYAVFENGVLKEYGELTNKKKGEEAVNQMCLDIYGTLSPLSVDICVCEMTVVERSAHTQRLLSEIVGTVRGYCLAKDIYFDRLRPTEWRKIINDNFDVEQPPKKREELKKWSITVVKQLYGIDVSDNVSDAILIGIAYICEYGDVEEFKKNL